MADLAVNFGGLELRNPLVVASADCARDIRQIKKAEECGASAVILKAVIPPGSVGLQTRMRFYVNAKEKIVHGLAGTRRLSYDEGLELVRAAKRETKIKIGVNIGIHDFTEPYAEVAKAAAEAGADFIELNMSPQIHPGISQKTDDWTSDPLREARRLSEYVKDLPRWVVEGTRLTKQAVDIPVMVKICPQEVDVMAIAKAAEEGGADAIDAINAFGGSFAIDIFGGAKPLIPFTKRCMLQSTGTLMKYYAEGIVARVSRTVKVPVMGTGGLMNWRDVVEMIMFGATTVSFCTLLMIDGFQAMAKIEKGLKRFMEQQGYNRIDDFIGLAHQYIADSMPACETMPIVARVDKEKCTGCGICLRPAHCLAISMQNEKAVVNVAECEGCGTCFQLCPAKAIYLVEKL